MQSHESNVLSQEAIPGRVMLAESVDGLSLVTVQVYSPPVYSPLPTPTPIARVWLYCAVTGSSNTVSVSSVIVVEPLVQVTVLAGPPVEIQVRVSRSGSNVTPDIEIYPTKTFLL